MSVYSQHFVQKEQDTRLVSLLRHYQYEHRVFQQRERECYYSKRMLAQKEPLKYMCWICDAMQQATVALPIKVCCSSDSHALLQPDMHGNGATGEIRVREEETRAEAGWRHRPWPRVSSRRSHRVSMTTLSDH